MVEQWYFAVVGWSACPARCLTCVSVISAYSISRSDIARCGFLALFPFVFGFLDLGLLALFIALYVFAVFGIAVLKMAAF